MTRKRFIKLCMARVSKNTAITLADIARKFDSYKHAYQYISVVGERMFCVSFKNSVARG